MQAVSIPMLPYIPPMDSQLFDIMFNSFGLTKPDIADDAKRLEGYWKLLETVAGASAEATRELLQRAFDNARTSRELVIDPEVMETVQRIMKEALNDGVQYKVSDGYTTETEIYNQLLDWQYFNAQRLPASTWAQYYAVFNNRFGNGNWKAVAVYAQYGVQFQIALGAVPKNYNMIFRTNFAVGINTYSAGWFRDGQSSVYNCSYYTYQGNTAWGDTGWSGLYHDNVIGTGNQYSGSIADGIQLGAVYASVVPIAQNNDVASAINSETLIPITADTIVENGVIDTTKPFRIHLPVQLPVPADTAVELPAVQEKLGVVPLSDDVADTVSQLKQASLESVGSASEYAFDFTQYFPFCLPFDAFRIIGAFIAEPEAPKFSYTIVNPWANDEEHNIVLEIDLSIFDQVAEILRTLESILFVVGLCVVTRSLYLRG